MEIQDFLIAALQNILVLANHSKGAISKSTAQVGQCIQTSETAWASFSMRSFVINLVNQLILPFSSKKSGLCYLVFFLIRVSV